MGKQETKEPRLWAQREELGGALGQLCREQGTSPELPHCITSQQGAQQVYALNLHTLKISNYVHIIKSQKKK